MVQKKLKIALIGTRGIPAKYGGFETFAEEVSKEWVSLGHNVTVYSRKNFFEKYQGQIEYCGINIRAVSTIKHKYLETPLNALMAYIDTFKFNYDIILICNAANSPFAFLLKLKKAPVLINVDGIERNRTKWNAIGRLWYKIGERSSTLFADRVVSDADCIDDYYKKKYNTNTALIRYGARVNKIEPGNTLQKFQLKKNNYILYVSRLEPENNALGVIQAYTKVKTNIPLVIVGDAPYSESYKNQLRSAANENVIFTGYQFGEAYYELRTNCLFYIQATEVGGTHPALVEAICYGNCIVANDVPEHREVLLDSGLYYKKNNFNDLSEIINNLLKNLQLIENFKKKAENLGKDKYNWQAIAKQYLDEFFKLLA